MGKGKIIAVVGGQYGSEGKGAVTAHLIRREEHPLVIRVGGNNAGHTAYDELGRAWAFRTVPVGILFPHAICAIARGSEVEQEVLDSELAKLQSSKIPVDGRLFIDKQATVQEAVHREVEREQGLNQRIGSTQKGIGAARSARIMRSAKIWQDVDTSPRATCVLDLAIDHLKSGNTVIIEASQGFGLGLHAGFYPKCTSTDCTAIDALAAVGLSPWAPYVEKIEPYVVLRTFPIRVAGDSGPMFRERTWEELGEMTFGYIKPEVTTVTKKTRRVGDFDPVLARRAVEANGGENCKVILTFLDYWFREAAGLHTRDELSRSMIEMIGSTEKDIRAPIVATTTGPDTIVWL